MILYVGVFRCLCFIMAAKRYLISCYDMDDGDGGGVHTFPVCLLVSRGLFTCIKKGFICLFHYYTVYNR